MKLTIIKNSTKLKPKVTTHFLGVLYFFFFSKATLNRLANLKVTCTNRCALSKLDVLAAKHDQPLKDAKETITAENSKLKELKEQTARVAHVCSGTCLEQCLQGQVSSKQRNL